MASCDKWSREFEQALSLIEAPKAQQLFRFLARNIYSQLQLHQFIIDSISTLENYHPEAAKINGRGPCASFSGLVAMELNLPVFVSYSSIRALQRFLLWHRCEHGH